MKSLSLFKCIQKYIYWSLSFWAYVFWIGVQRRVTVLPDTILSVGQRTWTVKVILISSINRFIHGWFRLSLVRNHSSVHWKRNLIRTLKLYIPSAPSSVQAVIFCFILGELPVVLYGCETFSLTLREQCRLRRHP